MNSQVNELEKQLKDTKEQVAIRDTVLRLTNNRDFKKIILEDFCEAHAARNIRMSVDTNIDEKTAKACIAAGQAAGHLKQFLSFLVQRGNHAAGQVEQIEEALVEARGEEDLPVIEAEFQEAGN